jgi:hypothetical protein
VVAEVQACFEFRTDWHRRGQARGPVRSYYAQVRSLLHDRPDLRPCLKRCRHCRVWFFTDPRNAGRNDLRCGFGWREAHRRANSTRRSVAFYRKHPAKKRALNRRRYLLSAQASRPLRKESRSAGGTVAPSGPRCVPRPILKHVRMVVSLIERRRVSLEEVLRMLAQKGRQHRIGRFGRPVYGALRIRDRGS